jgi:hypothetical protein
MIKALKSTTAVAPFVGGDALPAGLADQAARDAGRGVSTSSADQLVPMLRIAQTNSPEVDKRGPEHVDGLEPGDFLLRGAVNPARSGTDGLEFLLCAFKSGVLEFLPARQGFVARHDATPSDARAANVDEDGRVKRALVRADGNLLLDVRELFLWLPDAGPVLFSCTSTLITFARKLNTYAMQFRHPQTGGVMPAFSRKYRLVTIPAANALGRWFAPKFDDLGWASVAEYNEGRKLNALIEGGAYRAETPFADAGEPAPGREVADDVADASDIAF